jgi:tRNA splicing ligase
MPQNVPNRTSKLEIAEKLKSMKSAHKERADSALRSARDVVATLGKMFDEYEGRVLTDLEDEIDLLEHIYSKLDRERETLDKAKVKFKDIKEKLDVLLQRARDGEITLFEDFDFNTVRRTWELMLEVEEFRSKIDRELSRKHIEEMEHLR